MATYGIDFFGRWCVMLGPKCLGTYPTKEAARAAAEDYNSKH